LQLESRFMDGGSITHSRYWFGFSDNQESKWMCFGKIK